MTDQPDNFQASSTGSSSEGSESPATSADTPSGETGQSFAVDEPDTPAVPDAATQANIDAARYALSSRFARRPYNAPRSMLMLGLVMLGTIGLGVYMLQFYTKMKASTETAQLRRLQERDYVAPRQAEYERITGKKAPAEQLKPLSAEEKELMTDLLSTYGSQWQPDDDALQLDGQLKLARSSTTATAPSAEQEKRLLRGLEQQDYLSKLHAEYRAITGELPPVLIEVPLSDFERARMERLRTTYGSQWQPDEDARQMAEMVAQARARASTQPASTQPAASQPGTQPGATQSVP
jgi:hypothetical protein